MTVIKRLHLRENWPLWVATAGLVPIFSYLLYSQKIPKYGEFSTSPVIYISLVLANSLYVLLFLTQVSIVILLVVGLWTLKQRTIKRIVILCVFIPFPFLACMAVFSLFFDGANFTHKQSLKFNEQVYHLGEVTEDIFDIPSAYFVVYECERTGILCSPIYQDGGFLTESYRYEEIYSNFGLIADPANSRLYLQLGEKRFLIIPKSE